METYRMLSVGMAVVVMSISGCHRHQVVPDSLKAYVNQAGTFHQIKRSPSTYQGELVVLGGEVLSATRVEDTTCVEVLHLPLTDDLAPIMERAQSEGRFMVLETEQQILDPTILKNGTRVTIVGEVRPPLEGHAGACQYELPTLVNREMTVWENTAVSTPLTYYGSPYGYGFRPYYFSGIYGVHGLD